MASLGPTVPTVSTLTPDGSGVERIEGAEFAAPRDLDGYGIELIEKRQTGSNRHLTWPPRDVGS